MRLALHKLGVRSVYSSWHLLNIYGKFRWRLGGGISLKDLRDISLKTYKEISLKTWGGGEISLKDLREILLKIYGRFPWRLAEDSIEDLREKLFMDGNTEGLREISQKRYDEFYWRLKGDSATFHRKFWQMGDLSERRTGDFVVT